MSHMEHEFAPALKVAKAIWTAFAKAFDAFTERGWRRAIGWIGVYLMFGIAHRVYNGLPLPNVAELLGVILPTMGLAILRTLEKRGGIGIAPAPEENFPGGGMVNHA